MREREKEGGGGGGGGREREREREEGQREIHVCACLCMCECVYNCTYMQFLTQVHVVGSIFKVATIHHNNILCIQNKVLTLYTTCTKKLITPISRHVYTVRFSTHYQFALLTISEHSASSQLLTLECSNVVEDSNSVTILPSVMREATHIVCLTAVANTCMYEQIPFMYRKSRVISTSYY